MSRTESTRQQPAAYRDDWAYYEAEFRILDLRIQQWYAVNRHEAETSALAPFKGLVVTDDEVTRILAEAETDAGMPPRMLPYMPEIAEAEREAAERSACAASNGAKLALRQLQDTFGLSRLDTLCVLFSLAVEIENRYEKLFAYIQDDVTRKYPSPHLVLELCGDLAGKPDLVRSLYGSAAMEHLFERPSEELPLLAKPLKLKPRILQFLLQPGTLSRSLDAYTEIIAPPETLPERWIHEHLASQMAEWLTRSSLHASQPTPILYVHGPSGCGKTLHTGWAAQAMNRTLLTFHLDRAMNDSSFLSLVEEALLEARLLNALLVFDRTELLFPDSQDAQFKGFVHRLADASVPVILHGRQAWQAEPPCGPERSFIRLEVPLPNSWESMRLWEAAGESYPMETPLDGGWLAGKYRFSPGQITQALKKAAELTLLEQGPGKPIPLARLFAACSQQVHHRLERKSKKLIPNYTWEDIILPKEQLGLLRQACDYIKYRHVVYGRWGFDRKLSYGKGVSMLFTGPPGTGKTMSAEAIASELQLELYKVDLSQVVSKYIGETEKNLGEIFHEAERSNAILFFDETDALFGKRSEVKDAHDKYANVETSYLLQKMEEYPGITVLASNFMQNIDEAFLRRLQFIIKYPFPDAEHRELIWRRIFPVETPRDDAIDYPFLAKTFQVSGGNIKNIALASAFLAASGGNSVGMKEILQAIKNELSKTGKIVPKDQLGGYADLLYPAANPLPGGM